MLDGTLAAAPENHEGALSATYESDTDDQTVDSEAAKAPGSESNDEILAKARREYQLCQSADSENRTMALDDLRFISGGEAQWDVRAVSARKADGRPIITVNDLPTFIHQVTNDQRLNRPGIKVHPVDDNADLETAKIEQGMIRHIEYDSNADVAYDRAVNSAATIGFGFWRLVTEYESETSFNQKIMFKSIRNALSVRIDPLSTEPDGSDMQFAFVESLMSKDEFKKEYPNAKAATANFAGDASYAAWISDQNVLVCDYYCIKRTEEEVVLLSNGESGFKADLLEMPPGVTIVQRRKGERRKVMLYKITGADILETTEIKCKWIPVFPVYGDEIDIEGKVIRSGLVRNAKGPAQSYNVMISGATEEVALRTKAPYIGAEGQFEGHEQEWMQANNRAFPYLEYKATMLDGVLAPPPQRQPMADIPAGMLAMAMHAQDNKKKTMGLFDASLGARGTATSGKQELAQQREGDTANYHYYDGLLRTLRHCGRCLGSMIPHYYDTARVVRIMGEDDTVTFAKINEPNVEKKAGEDGKVRAFLNNVSAAEFDFTVSSGPSYSTMRQENVEFFTNAMQAAKDPATAAVVTYLAMKNQDAIGAEEATKMLKVLLPAPVQAAMEEGDEGQEEMIQTPKGPLPVSQAGQAIAHMDQQLQAATEALEHAKAADVQNKERELAIKAKEAETKAFEAETARMEARAKAAAEAERAKSERMKAEASLVQAQADLLRAQAEALKPPEPPKAAGSPA